MSIPSSKVRTQKILDILKRAYPAATCALHFENPLELLIATILSAQCTDARVNIVAPTLFKTYPSAADFAAARITDIERMVRSTGFYKNKARSIKNCSARIVTNHHGVVPQEMDALTALPGVGRKTANVVRGYAFHLPAVICDTHVLRVTARLGLTKEKDPTKVEYDLQKLLPEKDWTMFSTVVMFHGRQCCYARKPACFRCPIAPLCPSAEKV